MDAIDASIEPRGPTSDRDSDLAEKEPQLTVGGELAAHPGPREYVKVAIVLAIATAVEVALYYMELPDAVLVSLLLFFAVIKFSLVALWFMHLRFDSRIFRRLFITGIILAISVYVIVLLMFGVFIS